MPDRVDRESLVSLGSFVPIQTLMRAFDVWTTKMSVVRARSPPVAAHFRCPARQHSCSVRDHAVVGEVVPLYYERDRDGLPREWIARSKRAIRTLGWRFSADRMVMDYVLKTYIPAAGGTSSDVSCF